MEMSHETLHFHCTEMSFYWLDKAFKALILTKKRLLEKAVVACDFKFSADNMHSGLCPGFSCLIIDHQGREGARSMPSSLPQSGYYRQMQQDFPVTILVNTTVNVGLGSIPEPVLLINVSVCAVCCRCHRLPACLTFFAGNLWRSNTLICDFPPSRHRRHR